MTKDKGKRPKEKRGQGTENSTERSEPTREQAAGDATKDVEEQAAESSRALEITKQELADLRERAEERDVLFAKLQRATADYQNYKKRMVREMLEVRKFALQDFLSDFLPVMDHFTRALEAGQAGNGGESLIAGVKMVEDEIYKVLTAHGVEPIKSVGGQFDPAFHEAVFSQETEEEPDHAILEELQRGFILHGRVIRPARVKVAVRPQPLAEDEAAES